MIERYHLVLAIVASSVGLLVALADRCGPRPVSRRATGIVVACTVGLWWDGQMDVGRGVLAVAAAVLLVLPDEQPPEHPLGRWVLPMAWVSLVGVWVGVPDTEAPVAALGCLGPLACSRLAQGRGVGRVGWVSLGILVVASAWIGASGWGAARATACAVGAVLVAPLVLGWRTPPLAGRSMSAVLWVHIVFALAVPRVVMRMDPLPAAVLGGVSLTALAAVVAVLARRSGPARSGTPG